MLVSDPMRFQEDTKGIIDDFMRIKKDGHIQFYSSDELDKLFINNGFYKAKQIVTDMKFPFAPNTEYIELFDKIKDKDKLLYEIVNENGVIWVNHINVGNTIFVKA